MAITNSMRFAGFAQDMQYMRSRGVFTVACFSCTQPSSRSYTAAGEVKALGRHPLCQVASLAIAITRENKLNRHDHAAMLVLRDTGRCDQGTSRIVLCAHLPGDMVSKQEAS